jgi:MoxR-like ATPase
MGASRVTDRGLVFEYRPRIADAELEDRLAAIGAVLIEGPRGCGKTATGLQVAASAVRLDVDDEARAAGFFAARPFHRSRKEGRTVWRRA